ncbi:fibrinogen-like protein 1 [Drosophila nasuta]|uniref:fibrinogen-like protein 1 n=1 Tax=Drosophila nasuta TaxID=42062 RepID=UPI00295F1EAD|nr:fibrinogen-like protein 1 [Drosophila nasuta]
MLIYSKLLSIIMLCTLMENSFKSIATAGLSSPSITMFKDMESECNSYCIGIVKPILQQTKQTQFTELQDQIRNLNEIIKDTEKKLSEAEIKLGVCEDATRNRETLANEQLNRKTMQLTELQHKVKEQDAGFKKLEAECSNLRSSLGICEENIKNREVQYAQLLDLNISCNNSSKIKDELLATSKALVERHKSAASSDIIKVELKEQKINEMEAAIKEKDTVIMTHNLKIENQTSTIMKQTEEIAELKAQLSDYESPSCYGKSTDVHVIRVPGSEPFPVFCDSVLTDSGWTVIQRRRDGSITFNRNWTDYTIGFGDLRSEFFIGLQKLHLITQSQHHELYIFLQGFDEENRYAYYDHFLIGNETDDFKIVSLGLYKGTAGDALSSQKDMKFSTPDRDNDRSTGNCAKEFRSGWWYRKCYYCNLNGEYFNGKTTNQYGINWFSWHKNSLQFVQMMIRPKPH